MTRILTLTCLLAALSSAVLAQKIRYTDTSNKWVLTYASVQGNSVPHPPSRNYYSGDTMINGLRYNRMIEEIQNTVNKITFVREDTNTNVIYYGRFHHQTKAFSESVYIDYNWQVGDTFKPYEHYYVTSVDSMLINNTWHKLIEFYCPNGPLPGTTKTMKLLEGVGYISNPTAPEYSWTMRITLNCFFNNNTKPNIPVLPLGNQGGCSDTELAIEDNAETKKTINIYPQPAHDRAVIELPYPIDNGKLELCNILGQPVLRQDFQQRETLEISRTFPPGIYVYRISDNTTRRIHSGKLVFRD
jgi:hypothetical protein